MSDPKSVPDPMTGPWYVKVNDLYGGWAIMVEDHTPAFAQTPIVATVESPGVASHLAILHNAWLADQEPGTDTVVDLEVQSVQQGQRSQRP